MRNRLPNRRAPRNAVRSGTSVFAERTSPANLARINAMFTQMESVMGNLAGRWADESAYENINDYAILIRRRLPDGFRLLTMLRRPFGFTFSIGTDAVYRLTVARNGDYEWKRIK